MLIQLDPGTGAGTAIAPINFLGPVTDIEFRSDGVLFGATGGGFSNVITIDPVSGAETLVGNHASGKLTGLEFVGDTLYGAFTEEEGTGSELVIVDQGTGA